MQIMYGDELLLEVESDESLQEFLRNIKVQFKVSNPMLELIYSPTIRLIIGLSEKWCVISYMNEDDEYYIPLTPNDSLGTIVFTYDGQPSEQPIKHCVEFDTLLKASVEFFATGKLPSTIEWKVLK